MKLKRSAEDLENETIEQKYSKRKLVKLNEIFDSTSAEEDISDVDFVSTYDQILRLTLNRAFLINNFPLSKTKKKKFPYLTSLHLFAEKVVEPLKRGWGDRVANFSILWNKIQGPAPFPSKKPNLLDESGLLEEETILIGLRLSADWNTPITRGPSANTSDAKGFREFYGEKSELRKFVDNDICEAVVWTTEISENELEQIPCLIAKYLLRLHYKIQESDVTLMTTYPMEMISETTSYSKLSQAYDKLAQTLRNLKDLPLAIVGVQCLSSYYRKTEPFPPPIALPKIDKNCLLEGGILKLKSNYHSPMLYTPSIEVLISLEQSGRWGDNMHVIAKLKTAFYLELATALKAHKFRIYPLENRLLDSIVFSISIFQAREIAILRKHEESGNKAQIPKNMDSKLMEKQFVHIPNMLLQLHSLSQRFPAFGKSCQLARRWLSSHFLNDAFEEIALELLMAKVFLNRDEENSSPKTPFAGFTQFLHLLANHDFVQTPILVDINGIWAADKTDDLIKQFQKIRVTLPSVNIITPADETGSRYTRSTPEAVILKRIISLASIALNAIIGNITQYLEIEFQTLFHTNTSIYDIVIHLLHHQVVRGCRKLKTSTKCSILPIIDYDPVEKLVADLRNSYDSVALFFYDKYGGNQIGVMLRPTFRQNRVVRISNCQIRRKSINGKELLPDIQALIEDFRLIGKRLITEISVNPSLKI